MSDLYTEVLVKKQQTGKDKAIKGVLKEEEEEKG